MRGSTRGRCPSRIRSHVCKRLHSRRLRRIVADFQAVKKVRQDFFDSLQYTLGVVSGPFPVCFPILSKCKKLYQ